MASDRSQMANENLINALPLPEEPPLNLLQIFREMKHPKLGIRTMRTALDDLVRSGDVERSARDGDEWYRIAPGDER